MGDIKPIFRDLTAEEAEPEATSIESLCMNCHENGVTRILLTKIPYYKEVVLMSFSCEKCGYQNNEIQSGAAISPQGIRIELRVTSVDDLNRQVVKSDYTSIKLVEVDFEIPAGSQKGEITTVEGIINRSVQGLEQDQIRRRIENPEVALKIDEFIDKLNNLKLVESPFTLILEDISGNSFVENPKAPQIDPNCKEEYFKRNKEQDHQLGIYDHQEIVDENVLQPIKEDEFQLEDLQGEVLQFPTNCPNCGSPCVTNMKVTNIPHFKEVIIMATVCDACGNRTNEVKSGAGIEPQGVHIEVEVENKSDFSRDVLKSETCDLKIPELDLEVGPHALGGRFTTVEGLLIAIKDQLNNPQFSHMFGDSQNPKYKEHFQKFFEKFEKVLNCEFKVTIVLDDPAGNSYIQSLEDDGLDSRLKITHYERSFEQNEELGLNDIKTEDYEAN